MYQLEQLYGAISELKSLSDKKDKIIDELFDAVKVLQMENRLLRMQLGEDVPDD